MYIVSLDEFQLLNHKLPFSQWCLDHAYKEAGKLRAHFSSESVATLYQSNDGRNTSNQSTRRFYLKTNESDLTEEEKMSEVWHLAETDRRIKHPLAANTFVMNTEKQLPLSFQLNQGIYVYYKYINTILILY